MENNNLKLDKTNIYINLSKLNEYEIKEVYEILKIKNENIYHSDRLLLKMGKSDKRFKFMTLNSGYSQWISTEINIHDKTEISLSEFKILL